MAPDEIEDYRYTCWDTCAPKSAATRCVQGLTYTELKQRTRFPDSLRERLDADVWLSGPATSSSAKMRRRRRLRSALTGVLRAEVIQDLARRGWRRDDHRAAVMREDVFDDACTVFLEARHASGETHAVGVLIDNNLDVMAKDILLA